MEPHLNGCSWQDDSEVGSQLLNGFGKFGFPVLDDVTLIKDTIVEFYISAKVEKGNPHYNCANSSQNTKLDIELKGYSLKKVNVITYNIVWGYYEIVFLHLVLQPAKIKAQFHGSKTGSINRIYAHIYQICSTHQIYIDYCNCFFDLTLPHSLCRRPGVVQWVEVLFAAELAHLIHPVTSQCGRTHN